MYPCEPEDSLESCYYLMNQLHKLVEKKMYNVKNQALKKLSSIVAYSNLEEIAHILSHSYLENISSAEKIAQQLDLEELDFLALQEDIDGFKAEYLKDYQEAERV